MTDPADGSRPAGPVQTEAELIRSLGFWKIMAEDFARHGRELSKPGLQALWIHRIGVYAATLPKPFGLPLSVVYALGFRFCRAFYGIELRRTANIGRRLEIGHQHGIVIHDYARIGDDCVIRQGVTFGASNEWERGKGPVIGDRVSFSPGCVVVGNVTIGDDVMIGPNCVVANDVPANRILFIPPPRVFPREVKDTAASV